MSAPVAPADPHAASLAATTHALALVAAEHGPAAALDAARGAIAGAVAHIAAGRGHEAAIAELHRALGEVERRAERDAAPTTPKPAPAQ